MRASLLAILLLSMLTGTATLRAGEAAAPQFELRDGDRVVFLGNTLIERAQKYGYWETMLTARYPNRSITFRNLGWDGDTVWAESRGYFDAPQVGYQRMLDHVKELRPTVLFLGYGNNEAFAGEAGLPRFVEQYNKLLDDLTKVSAKGVRFVILSPIRHEDHGPPLPNPAMQNRNLELYSNALRELAAKRDHVYVDFFTTVIEPDQYDLGPIGWTTNGVHLTEDGYWHSSLVLQRQLGLDAQNAEIRLDATGTIRTQRDTRVTELARDEAGLTCTVENFTLPQIRFDGLDPLICIDGLPEGDYALKINGKTMGTQSAEKWRHGMWLDSSPGVEQWEQLRRAIIAKNRLYFHHWRPQNITYLFGFRKHEQGQNAKETAEFERLVAEKEAEIARLKKPVPHTYELRRVEK